MKFFHEAKEHSGDGGYVVPKIASYDSWLGDARASLDGHKPSVPDRAITNRAETARVAKLWRRLRGSAINELINQDGGNQAHLVYFLANFNGRLPTREELNFIDGQCRAALDRGNGDRDFDPTTGVQKTGNPFTKKSGGMLASDFMRQALEVYRAMEFVPGSLLNLVEKSSGVPEPSPVPDKIIKLREAKPMEIPLEIWYPKALYLERATRGALHQKSFLRPGESPKSTIEFWVDCSGSQDHCHALATASAIKMSRAARRNGHKVSLRFFAYKLTEPIDPEDFATVYAAKSGSLGGGDALGNLLANVAPETTDVVVYSDFCVEGQVPDKPVNWHMVHTHPGEKTASLIWEQMRPIAKTYLNISHLVKTD